MIPKKKPCKKSGAPIGKMCVMWSRANGCIDCDREVKMSNKSVKKLDKKPIRKVSKKRSSQNELYSIARRIHLKTHPNCEFPNCREKHTEENQLTIHHKNGRNGDRLLDTKYWMVVCMEHHRYIEEHREESYKKGWLIKRNGKENS